MVFTRFFPRPLQWILAVSLLLLLTMTVLRFIFFISYKPDGMPFSGSAFLMGLRFDIKFVCIAALCIMVLTFIPLINPVHNRRLTGLWNIVLTIVFLLLMLFYAVDYYYYDYQHQRLNASVLSFVSDARISSAMVWQTYPVIRGIAVVICSTLVAGYLFRRLLASISNGAAVQHKKRFLVYLLCFLLFAWGVFGKAGQFNLRWSDAFTLNSTFKGNVALNPFQSFFSTLRFKDMRPGPDAARENYTYMASVLGIQHPDSIALQYERSYNYTTAGQQPNIVVVICESFSMYKSSMSGNPLNTTPFFNSMCRQGVFFNRCFTPAFPTARGVWATVTGLPDVLLNQKTTASRNPEVVDQHVIMNDFDGFEKFYFIGGNPSWANIKGVLMNNIENLHLYSQDSFKAKKLDVWGIDDKNLFLEANSILAKQLRPFIAVIQTADNHRPYSIPEQDLAFFKKITLPKDTLTKYGFDSNEELNAFRYTDFCYEQFIKAASAEAYFNNTIFIFTGDHGIPGNADAVYPLAWRENSLSYYHVPLLFYAPALLQPQLHNEVCSQLDIMPSAAHLARVPHKNTALGKNLFDTITRKKDYAFIIDHDYKTIGMVNSNYYYTRSLQTGKTTLANILNNNPLPPQPVTDSIKMNMDKFATAFYQTALYMLYHNKK
ncbi:MAG TPA: LTA synthase family protein [Ferruginibacter sp.]|nr:LTA synthase family protein [Ferruginibacter sp.]HMP19507.1 LTA synthase family protein [Ferruginibacter sp.]